MYNSTASEPSAEPQSHLQALLDDVYGGEQDPGSCLRQQPRSQVSGHTMARGPQRLRHNLARLPAGTPSVSLLASPFDISLTLQLLLPAV
jgi:hypothetical protein